MITKYIKYIAAVLFMVGTAGVNTSCSNWLDVSPKSNIKGDDLLSDETGFRDIVIGAYSLMNSNYSYGSTLSYGVADVLAQYYTSLATDTYHNMYYWSNYNYTESGTESEISQIWTVAYKAIANLNYALEYIDEQKDVFSTTEMYNLYKGEILALRAMFHFDMLRLFAPSPADEGGLTELALPYVRIYTTNPQSQSTIEEFIDFVVADLVAASELMEMSDPYGPNSEELPDEDDNELLNDRNYRLNYYAVNVLLSRVYAYAGYSDEAYNQAVNTIEIITENSNFDLSNTAATSENPYFTNEVLFLLGVNSLDEDVKSVFSTSSYSTIQWEAMTLAGYNNIFASSGSDSDTRQSLFQTLVMSNANYMMPSKLLDQEDLPMLKISELYLIAAEFAPTDELKLEYLNILRANRGREVLTTISNFDYELYYEYRREFIGEGQLFYFYKRLMFTYIGENDTYLMDSENYTLPLPVNELDFGSIAY